MTTQETIDDANNKLSIAENNYNYALQNEAAAYAAVVDWRNLVAQCNVSFFSQSSYAKADRDSCGHKNSGPCQSVSTCKGNVDSYNSNIDNWNSKKQETGSKKRALDSAISYKDSVISNAQNDPTFIAQQQQNILDQKILDQQKEKNKNITIAVVVIIIVIVSAILIWKNIK